MKRILIADDDVLTCLSIGLALLRDGYAVLYAEDGMVALELAQKRNPDLIICDLEIPGLDGYELHRVVREDARTQHIPVLFLTDGTPVNSERVGANAGRVAFLPKPFTRDQLISTLQRSLHRKRLKR